MYERSAIVLERYFENFFGFDKNPNLKDCYTNYTEIIEEIEKYQIIITEEEGAIQEFDKIANEIQNIQKTQEKLYKSNQKFEEERYKLFNILDENPENLKNKLDKIEGNLDKNNENLKELKENYIEILGRFLEQQKERNKYAKSRRSIEGNHYANIEIKMILW